MGSMFPAAGRRQNASATIAAILLFPLRPPLLASENGVKQSHTKPEAASKSGIYGRIFKGPWP
jgi:hypothetical protein